ncbi:TPA: MazG-like family protein [Pasteurella multocida]|uniref:MazG-like family protein n=1 Tax=Pasteurella multocida TaxID=747 RepID=UPI002B6AE415|nr:MazG-like family protein [Pasteurella multocida]MEB3491599.1 MazG-like family protein [Pasteurella multocida]HDR1056965.1 MazG-like family protein [Pasteurella multocida]HDR1065100.1 MazG-like family protein [Pasteurella multocida]HDR1857102.1 MazG-like family protein [Pasteurella multocida]
MNKEIKELIDKIEQWAEDRNLTKGSTPQKQFLKLMEEFGELCSGVAKNKPEVIKDSIGDCFVALIILTQQLKVDIDFEYIFDVTYKNLKNTNDDPIVSMVLFTARAGGLANSIGYENDPSFELAGMFSLLVLISSKLYLNLTDCVQHAYNQIKDRKGKMVDGVFVKEEDL